MSEDTKTGITGGEWMIAVDHTAFSGIVSGINQIANVFPCYTEHGEVDPARHEANRRAIRAVPGMIAALKAVLDATPSVRVVPDDELLPLLKAIELVKEALAKAGIK